MRDNCEYCSEVKRVHPKLAINRIHKAFKCSVRDAIHSYSISHLARSTGVARDVVSRLKKKLGIR